MFWSSLLGSIIGVVVGVFLLIAVVLIYDELQRGKKKTRPTQDSGRPTLDQILESQLEQHLLERFEQIFPGWNIHSTKVRVTGNESNLRKAVRLRTEAGEIDMLCVDEDGSFVVVELKRGKAPDTVVTQIDRYMAWVERTLCSPNQKVRGVIIARSFDKHIQYSLLRRQDIQLWAFNWCLDLRVVRDPSAESLENNVASDSSILLQAL